MVVHVLGNCGNWRECGFEPR